jgi:hypothetical protein
MLIDKMINESTASCNILVSKYNSSTMDGTILKINHNNNVCSLIIKRDQIANADYSNMAKTVNIYFFKKAFIRDKFFPMVETYIKTQSNNSYYELVLGSLIYFGNDDIRAVYIDESEWCEIDDINDLKRASLLFTIK